MTSSHAYVDMINKTIGTKNFYRDRGASAIMRAAHFPDEILSFLQMECLFVLEAALRYRCGSLVEFGCYDGRALEVARAARIYYLGVDVNPLAIEALRRRIADEGLQEEAGAVLSDATHTEHWQSGIRGERPLQLLPFNLLGNFHEPELVLKRLCAVGGIGVVSVFNEAPWTNDLRRSYYTASGISPLEEEPGPYGGVVFRGGGFRSQSFDRDSLLTLLDACGATVLRERTNRFGHCMTVRLAGSQPGASHRGPSAPRLNHIWGDNHVRQRHDR